PSSPTCSRRERPRAAGCRSPADEPWRIGGSRVRFIVAILGIALVVLAYVFRAFFHDLLLFIYVHPALFEGFVLWLLLHLFVLRQIRGLTRVRRSFYRVAVNGRLESRPFHYRWLGWV